MLFWNAEVPHQWFEYSYEFADILRLILFDTHRRCGVMALPHGMWERDKGLVHVKSSFVQKP
ncbi:hypothetical protein QUF74_05295 [Candidatus Halobeggiatoa sp. HSG11]|nr:hypothetical protein [Candidatus Halobeggiatoa sp. HSG11]